MMDVDRFEYLKNIASAIVKELNPILSTYLENIEAVMIDTTFSSIIINTKHMKINVYVDRGYRETIVELKTRTVITKPILNLINEIFEKIEKVVGDG